MHTHVRAAPSFIAASRWHEKLGLPALSTGGERPARIHVHRFTGIAPEMVQPALKDSLVCLHLGGAKRVQRWHEGRMTVQDVELGSLTFMPARQENRWLTQGPVDFAHLTLAQGFLHQIAVEEFDAEPAACELIDRVGARDPLVEQLFMSLVRELEHGSLDGRLYPESLLTVLTVALLRSHSMLRERRGADGASRPGSRKGGLAGWQLRRVVDHMAEHLATDIALQDLTELTGLSRAQFFRAFKQSTGYSPHRFLTRMRISQACVLLEASAAPLDDIAAATGFSAAIVFAQAFKRQIGLHPRCYRKSRL